MYTAMRRLFVLSVLGGGGYAAWSWWQRQSTDEVTAAPEWPPLSPVADTDRTGANGSGPSSGSDTRTVRGFADTTSSGAAAGDARWVEPVDDECPDGYPIKANDKSGIYHVPGGRFYARTIPERCYASAEDAEADGFRAAKA
jgi:hypothetical protein